MRSLSVFSSRAGRARLVLACALVAMTAAGCGMFKRHKAEPPAAEKPEQSAGARSAEPANSPAPREAKGASDSQDGISVPINSLPTATNAPSQSASPSMKGASQLPVGVEEVLAGANALPPGASLPKSIPVIATVTSGQLRGEQWPDGTFSFRGIPYARPPTGALRWKAPEPVEAWTGVRDALDSGPPCLQAPLGWNNKDALRSREDCLYLDVRTPAFSPTARKPVMVWIHGGGNRAGSGSGYLSSSIVQRGVVLVTVQYRLGVFGFLSHPALTAESKQKSSGNYALLDQIAALQWVKANIAKLGGDPNNVTIFGHSSGGQDVGLLMLSPLAKGLFAKAIQQSGTAGFGLPARTLAENEKLGEAFAARIVGKAGAKDPLEKLRAAYTTTLLAAGNKLDAPALDDDSFVWLQPVVDGWVLPRAPVDLLAEHKQPPVPLLIGSAARELTLYGGADNARHAIEAAFGANSSKAIPLYGLDQLRTPPDDPRLGDMPTQLAADINFRCPVTIVSKHQLAAGAHVWQYQLDRPAPGGTGLVSHGAELPYVFDALPIFGPAASRDAPVVVANAPSQDGAAHATPVSSTTAGSKTPRDIKVNPLREPNFTTASLQAYWVRFAMTGDPNGPGLPRWPEYTRKREYLEFSESGPIAKHDLRALQCDLLNLP
jgi:para-nitrobenzyl esterase